MVIQRILRHASVSTRATYYIKTAAEEVRNAMTRLEDEIAAGIPSSSWGSESGTFGLEAPFGSFPLPCRRLPFFAFALCLWEILGM